MSSIWTIRRSAEDAKLTGLCGGIARHWGVDPVLVRVGCALLALSGGIGVVLYIAGWLLIPVEGKDKAPMDDLLGPQARRLPREIWIVILVVACAVTLAVFGSIIPFGFGPAVILAAIWYFGYYKNRPTSNNATPPPATDSQQLADPSTQEPQFLQYPGPATPFTEAAEAWQQRIQEIHRTGQSAPPPAPPTYPPTPPQQPHPDAGAEPVGPAATLPPTDPTAAFLATPDPVGLYTDPEPASTADTTVVKPVKRWQTRSARRLLLVSVIVMGLVMTGLGVADGLGASVPVVGYLSAALLVIGLTLVAGARFGRPRFALLAGFVVLISVVASTLGGPIAQQRGWGDHEVTYSQVGEFPTTADHRELGTLSVDLRDLQLTEDATYAASVELGRLQVRVPDDVNVRVQYQVEAGSYVVHGEPERNGADLQGVTTSPDFDPKKPTLTLNLIVEAGQLEVQP